MKYGSALDEDVIESHAQSLQAKQELLTTELQLTDLTMQLDDSSPGLPLTTLLELDPNVPGRAGYLRARGMHQGCAAITSGNRGGARGAAQGVRRCAIGQG